MRHRHSGNLRATLSAGAALAAVIASPAFAQNEAVSTAQAGSDKPLVLAQNTQSAPQAASGGTTVQEVVVTGYAGSIQNATRTKKISNEIIESISAEDIGKLPDVSITDALSRLPGLAVQQASGRAKYISIRGFGPDYTTATLNGRTIATVDDNRRFDYGQYPGDLFQEIDVIKTPSADLLNAGLAGTVNLQTYDPLKQKNTIAINAQGAFGQYKPLNPEADSKGYKVSALYVHKFADDTIGVSLGASVIKDPTQDYHWATGGGNGNYYGPPSGDAAGNIGPDDIQNYANSNTLTRQSGFGHVVYRPNDKFEMSLDALYTKSEIREYSRGWEMPLASWSHDTQLAGTETATQMGPYKYIKSEQWLVNPVIRNDFNTSDGDTFAVGWNGKYKFSDSLKASLDVNYSRAKRHDNTYEIYGGNSFLNLPGGGGCTPTTCATATITRLTDGSYGVNIAGANYASNSQVFLTDPQGWGQVGFNNVPDLRDTVKGLRAELDGDLHWGGFKSWEIGINYADESRVSNYSGYFICLPGAPGTSTVGNCGNWPGLNGGPNAVAIPNSIVSGSVAPFGVTGTRIIAVNSIAAQNLLRTAPQSFASDTARDWTVEEKITTGYLQANFDTQLNDVRVRGNIGTQIVHSDQSSKGFVALSATTVAPRSGGTNYTDVLPSANVSAEVRHNLFVRFAISRTLARATLDDENASFSVGSCGATGCTTAPLINGKIPLLAGGGGNPDIKPYYSNNYDLSIERYFFHDQGKVALSLYRKTITNFTTQNQNLNTGSLNSNGPTVQGIYDFSAYSALVTTPGLLTNPNYTTLGYGTIPGNNGKGTVEGFEFSSVVPLKIITPMLDGLNVIGNFAHTDSQIKFSNGNTITLPGLSRNVYQWQIFYEKMGFNARASYTHRSGYLGDYALFNAQVTANLTKAQDTLDAQVGYDFKTGPLNGLSLYIQGHNLTNSSSISYVNYDPREVNIRDQYGATYLMGATYKF